MSTTHAALIVAGVLAIGVPAVYWQLRRIQRAETERNQTATRVRATRPPTPPVIDTEHGINLADHDECELLYSLPAYGSELDLRFRQMQAEILGEQQEGEQP